MKKILCLVLLPFTAHASDFFVQDELADMVEEVVRGTQLKINISDMRSKYVHIDQIDGVNVCSPEAQRKVMQLQTAFSLHPNLFRARSMHGVYLRQNNGKIKFTALKLPAKPSKCEHLSVSIR